MYFWFIGQYSCHTVTITSELFVCSITMANTLDLFQCLFFTTNHITQRTPASACIHRPHAARTSHYNSFISPTMIYVICRNCGTSFVLTMAHFHPQSKSGRSGAREIEEDQWWKYSSTALDAIRNLMHSLDFLSIPVEMPVKTYLLSGPQAYPSALPSSVQPPKVSFYVRHMTIATQAVPHSQERPPQFVWLFGCSARQESAGQTAVVVVWAFYDKLASCLDG
jgi:hypothetical protein